MSEKKIVIPDGMLKAAMGNVSKGVTVYHSCRAALEAALRWQSENPLVPTFTQSRELWTEMSSQEDGTETSAFVREWIRHMYDAPEPDPVPDVTAVFETPFGRFMIDDRVPPGEIRLYDWNGPTLIRNIGTEPEVPEEIKEFLVDERNERESFFLPSTYNSRLIEAFNRGRKKA